MNLVEYNQLSKKVNSNFEIDSGNIQKLSENHPQKKQKKFPQIILLVSSILVIFSVVFFMYSLLTHRKSKGQKTVAFPTPSLFQKNTDIPNSATKTYSNIIQKYSFEYPSYLIVTQNNSSVIITNDPSLEIPTDKDLRISIDLKSGSFTEVLGNTTLQIEAGEKSANSISYLKTNNGLTYYIYYPKNDSEWAIISYLVSDYSKEKSEFEENDLDSTQIQNAISLITSTFMFLYDTSDWKTYHNYSLNFQIQHPPDFTVNESLTPGGLIKLTKETTTNQRFWISFYQNHMGSACANAPCDNIKEITVTLGNEKLKTEQIWPYTYNEYTFEINKDYSEGNDWLQITTVYPKESDLPLINQILSTFQFTD
jgi:hypothetical protein